MVNGMKTLTRRPQRSMVASPELAARTKLTKAEWVTVHAPMVMLAVAVVIEAGGGYAVAQPEPAWSIAGVVVLVIGVVVGALALFWRDAEPPKKRERQVRLDRGRKGRAHAGDEASRIPTIRYSRYSLQARRDGLSLKFIAVQHDRKPRLRCRDNPQMLGMGHVARTKKAVYDADRGKWEEEGIIWNGVVENPTVENVLPKLREGQEIVEQLENRAYAEALRYHQIDMVALAMQPPPLGPSTEAALIVSEERIEQMLDEA